MRAAAIPQSGKISLLRRAHPARRAFSIYIILFAYLLPFLLYTQTPTAPADSMHSMPAKSIRLFSSPSSEMTKLLCTVGTTFFQLLFLPACCSISFVLLVIRCFRRASLVCSHNGKGRLCRHCFGGFPASSTCLIGLVCKLHCKRIVSCP